MPPLEQRIDGEVDAVIVENTLELFTQGASSHHGSYLLAAWQALFPEIGSYGIRKLP